ncbi:hypothetical protein [Phytohabitans suffuscus]|uniref:Uncharacterized protein n=1 Tax=Phytohabitans suffuscus TaxID=624315 RepID=A0A6F8YDW2_9ACTN|nr:hypothetical protein [Phytohabitans suffuscus]BCB84250.1 hypothetical protein Psuf_015630 [Phytohabitans suffuscus]
MTIAPGFRAAAAASLFLLVACAQDGGDSTLPGDAPAPRDASAIALRIDSTGGFTTPGDNVARLPIVTVYGDGRAIVQGPQPAIYPGPALPNLQVIKLSSADVDKLVERATGAGVGTAKDLGQPPVADATSTRFTVDTAGGPATTEVYALHETADTATGLTADQVAARTKLRDLLNAVSDLHGTLGISPGSDQPYQPATLAAIASPYVAPEPAMPGQQPEVVWPGPALPGTPVGKGLETGCVTVTGAGTATALAAAGKANAATPWTSEGRKWTVILRPLLPDETGCADLLDT